jgi:hypothetical protein
VKTDRELMQQALEALEAGPDVDPIFAGETEAALRARLAEPETCKPALQVEAEPVAHRHEWFRTGAMEPGQMRCIECGEWRCEAAPPARRPLTDDEIDRVIDVNWSINNHKPTYVAHRAFARAIERAHKIGGNDD